MRTGRRGTTDGVVDEEHLLHPAWCLRGERLEVCAVHVDPSGADVKELERHSRGSAGGRDVKYGGWGSSSQTGRPIGSTASSGQRLRIADPNLIDVSAPTASGLGGANPPNPQYQSCAACSAIQPPVLGWRSSCQIS